MSNRFPDSPIYKGFKTPGRFEADIFDLEFEGELPGNLSGTFYRVGPDPQLPPRVPNDIFFNGDGIVSMFRFDGGHVDFKQRYIRTPKFVAERKARRALFGAYRNPFTDDDSVKGMIRGTGNTTVVFHAGQLLALKEDSPPVAMNPHTLETKGSWDFHGKLTSKTFTAHPKIDPNTGELVCFGYAAKGEATPDIAYYVVDKAGAIVHETWIQAPYSGMVHDFAVTKDYVVFPIVPITSDLERLKRGAPHFMWDSRKDVYLGVLPRRGTAKDLRWFRGACRYSTHLFNGFNDGAKIYIDTPVAKGNVFPFFPDITGAPFDLPKSAPHISRWAIDMNSGGESFEETTFDTNITEFPRIDDRYHTQPHRHGYVSLNDLQKPWTTTWGPPQPFMYFNTMAHFDFAEQKLAKWYIGQGSDLEEVQFIPRAQNAPEGDGWLIALVNRHYEVRTELVVLDATRVADGPVATVYLPFRLRSGLHGTWVPSWQLPVEPIHT